MEFWLKVGIGKKAGLPNYGSFFAECSMEIPVNIGELGSPESLERLIRQSYAQCLSSVEDQLSEQGLVQSKPVKPEPAPQEKPKPSAFGQWLKDQAVSYGQEMPTMTRLLYKQVFPDGTQSGWVEQGKQLATAYAAETNPESTFGQHMVAALSHLDSSID